MGWGTRPVFQVKACDDPRPPVAIPYWAPQPAGYSPMLPISTAVGPMPVAARVQPLLITRGSKPFPNLDPNVGAFVPTLPMPPGRLDGRLTGYWTAQTEALFLQQNYVQYDPDLPPATIGKLVIGRSRIGYVGAGETLPPCHPAIP